MLLPDLKHIAEIELLSCGFQSAKLLGTKIITLFQLCKSQLSSQPHYDFGMRAIKTALEISEKEKLNCPAKSEQELVIEIIRKTVLCMLDEADTFIFEVIHFTQFENDELCFIAN